MKKIIIGLVSALLFGISVVNANIENEVYKIVSYKYDPIGKGFVGYAIGSSVLVKDNELITNAHVVLDSKNEPLGYYIACKTTDFEKDPECNYEAKLIKYDRDSDLALLEIEKKDFLGNMINHSGSINISTGKLSMGDDISIYGYPGIGGTTITFSKGKISGYQDGIYKTDTSIDQGNSGGGAFNKDGELIGIPNAITSSHSTLGWIIPASTVSNFLNDSSSGKVFESTGLDSAGFREESIKDLSLLNGVIKDYSIGKNITFEGIFDNYKFDSKVNYSNMSILRLVSRANPKIVSAIMRLETKNTYGISDKDVFTRFKNDYSDAGTGDEKCSRVISNAAICTAEDNVVLMLYRNKELILIRVGTYDSGPEKKDFINHLKIILKSLKIAKNTTESVQENIHLGDLEIKSNKLFYGIYSIDYGTQFIELIPKNQTFNNYITNVYYGFDSDIKSGKMTLKKMEEEGAKKIKGTDSKLIHKIIKNKNIEYLYVENSETGEISATMIGKDGLLYGIKMGLELDDNQKDKEEKYFSYMKSIFNKMVDSGISLK